MLWYSSKSLEKKHRNQQQRHSLVCPCCAHLCFACSIVSLTSVCFGNVGLPIPTLPPRLLFKTPSNTAMCSSSRFCCISACRSRSVICSRLLLAAMALALAIRCSFSASFFAFSAASFLDVPRDSAYLIPDERFVTAFFRRIFASWPSHARL